MKKLIFVLLLVLLLASCDKKEKEYKNVHIAPGVGGNYDPTTHQSADDYWDDFNDVNEVL